MRLTTAKLRMVIVNPASFVAAARTAIAGGRSFGNPQRAWLQAAIRAYFQAERDVDELWEVFNNKVREGASSPRREALASGAVRLLEQFIAWDEPEEAIPADSFPPIRDVPLGNHTIAMRRDLIYLDGAGYKVRQLWTDHELKPTHPRAVRMAAAAMLSVDSDLGPESTTGVEVWGLRHVVRRTWSRAQLLSEVDRLLKDLDAAALAIQQP